MSANTGHSDIAPADPTWSAPRWVLPALIAVVAVVVHVPGLTNHFLLDDFLQASMANGTFPVERGPFELYDFFSSDRNVLRDRGLVPWWSHPELTLRFLRPISSVTIWFDHRVFGGAPLPMHLHSFAWWIAVVSGAAMLFREILSRRPAWIAIAVYTLAPCHAIPVAWICNRDALVSSAFGFWGLWAFVRWRAGAPARYGAIAFVLFTLSLLGGEYGVSFGAYVLAFELFRRGDRIGRRLLGLSTFALPALVYLTVRVVFGYGARGSGFYADPFNDPVRFLQMAPVRLATLFLDAWLSLHQETLLRGWKPWETICAALAGAVILGWGLRRGLANADPALRRTVYWTGLGGLLAVTPFFAVVPSPRLLGAPMFGVAVATAAVLDAAWFPKERPARRGITEASAAFALALAFFQLVHAPVTTAMMGMYFRASSRIFQTQVDRLRQQITDADAQHVVVIRGFSSAMFLQPALDPRQAAPYNLRVLSQTGHVLLVRTGERQITLHVNQNEGVFSREGAHVFRDRRAPMAVGDVIELPGFRVTIEAVNDGLPHRVRFDFDHDIDAADSVWVNETSYRGYEVVTPPAGVGLGTAFDP